MKKSIVLILGVAMTLLVGFGSLNASNKQEYSMDRALCEKYVVLSRDFVDKGNLPMAQAYAQKAIQANGWDNKAWANYNDIIQQMAKKGEIPSYGTAIEASQAPTGPSASGAAPVIEGC